MAEEPAVTLAAETLEFRHPAIAHCAIGDRCSVESVERGVFLFCIIIGHDGHVVMTRQVGSDDGCYSLYASVREDRRCDETDAHGATLLYDNR